MPGSPRAARAFSVEQSFGPPLPGGAEVFAFPPAGNVRDTQARIMFANIKLTKVGAGVLLQSVSIHDEAGLLVFAGGLLPVNASGFPLPTTHLAIAGPEQARAPFFIPNVLIGTYGKDVYCLPGYSVRFNNIGALVGNSAVVTVFFERDGV